MSNLFKENIMKFGIGMNGTVNKQRAENYEKQTNNKGYKTKQIFKRTKKETKEIKRYATTMRIHKLQLKQPIHTLTHTKIQMNHISVSN